MHTHLINAALVYSLDHYKIIGILYKAVWLKKRGYKRGYYIYKITKGNK